MTPELQKVLEEWLRAMLNATQNVAGEIPAMLWEKVLLGRIMGLVFSVFLLGIMPLGAKVIWKQAGKLSSGADYDLWDQEVVRGCTLVALVVSVIIGVFVVIPETLTAWVAPRVYVMEWLKGLI